MVIGFNLRLLFQGGESPSSLFIPELLIGFMVNYRVLSSSTDPLFTSLVRLVRERDGAKASELSVHLAGLMDRGMRFVVASEGGHVVGYTLFETASRSRGRKVFSTVETYVSLMRRRQGIAHRLILSLSGLARHEGVSTIVRNAQSTDMIDLGYKMQQSPRLFASGRLKRKWAEKTRVILYPLAGVKRIVIRVRKNH